MGNEIRNVAFPRLFANLTSRIRRLSPTHENDIIFRDLLRSWTESICIDFPYNERYALTVDVAHKQSSTRYVDYIYYINDDTAHIRGLDVGITFSVSSIKFIPSKINIYVLFNSQTN